MRRKGFTLVELLVVIAIIALLMGILMPALARVRQLAFRMTCGSNLSGIGKAMLIYANDYDDELPRAGGRNSFWTSLGTGWVGLTRQLAYNITSTDGTGGNATISSCFYLLVKYAEVTPKSFICKGDSNTSEFTLASETQTAISELTQAWDFGTNPQSHCSYTYQAPWGTYALTTSSEPGFAVASDRNPYIPSPGNTIAKTFNSLTDTTIKFVGKVTPGNSACELYGNSIVHQEDGQEVMFLDGHVEFAKRAFCSLEDDNIYTVSDSADKGSTWGVLPTVPTTAGGLQPRNRKDSVLVHDPQSYTGGGSTRTAS
jgi:prepilin-type N-terminal cleavage/methylation domain-containing protein